MMYNNIIFDLDDTLLECSQYYATAKDELFQFCMNRYGVSKEMVESVFNSIDMASTTLPNAFGRHRFPRSFAATLGVLTTIVNGKMDPHAVTKAYDMGNAVFDAPYPLFDGAWEILTYYKKRGLNLFLVTKGDDSVQRRKIDIHNLTQIFPENHIHIVHAKNGAILTEIVESHNLDLSETVYVGDSLRDDVGSANEVGIVSVWLHDETKPAWVYENTNHIPTHTISHILELQTII